MIDFVLELDRLALFVALTFLVLYFVNKNKNAFLLTFQVLFLSHWDLFIPDAEYTLILFDCLAVLVAGFVLLSVYRSKLSWIIITSQIFLFISYLSSYTINFMYYKSQTIELYNISLFISEHILYIFWPHFIGCVIGLIYNSRIKGKMIKLFSIGGVKSGNGLHSINNTYVSDDNSMLSSDNSRFKGLFKGSLWGYKKDFFGDIQK